jgi:hypothetical protein
VLGGAYCCWKKGCEKINKNNSTEDVEAQHLTRAIP